MISVHDLGYQINGQTILDGMNLEFRRGEIFVILGPSGCGKSTFLRLVMGLIKPTSGWIVIDGVNTTNLSKTEWREVRRQMGMVFQSAALFDSLSVFENVAFSLRRNNFPESEIRRRVIQTLGIVGLDGDIAFKMPADLSGGMKKRTAIARAIAIKPPILLYDEPTTGLDPIIADTINELILDLQKNLGITSIVVTHDINSALKIADRIGLLHEGKLVEVKDRDRIGEANHPLMRQFFKNYRL
ncbi:MAG: ABC transporter ATP-binding protein [Bacillota bacterium]